MFEPDTKSIEHKQTLPPLGSANSFVCRTLGKIPDIAPTPIELNFSNNTNYW